MGLSSSMMRPQHRVGCASRLELGVHHPTVRGIPQYIRFATVVICGSILFTPATSGDGRDLCERPHDATHTPQQQTTQLILCPFSHQTACSSFWTPMLAMVCTLPHAPTPTQTPPASSRHSASKCATSHSLWCYAWRTGSTPARHAIPSRCIHARVINSTQYRSRCCWACPTEQCGWLLKMPSPTGRATPLAASPPSGTVVCCPPSWMLRLPSQHMSLAAGAPLTCSSSCPRLRCCTWQRRM